MPSVQSRAQQKLAERLKSILGPGSDELLIEGTHSLDFSDNLLPGLSSTQASTLREQLGQGSGSELKATSTGKRPGHAAYSSAALAINAFGRWLTEPTSLRISDLEGFTHLSVEAKLQIKHGGGLANLDVLLTDESRAVGIESKLTETLAEHKPTEWKDPYYGPEMQTVVRGAWQRVFEDSRSRALTPEHLDIEQLIKHGLALNSEFPDRESHLIYCYWEPANGDGIEIVRKHREEVEQLTRRLVGAEPTFHAVSYSDLFDAWRDLKAPPWVGDHVDSLEQRYGGIEL